MRRENQTINMILTDRRQISLIILSKFEQLTSIPLEIVRTYSFLMISGMGGAELINLLKFD